MKVMDYATASAQLKSIMDEVSEENETVVIACEGGKAVVMISLEEYNAQQETSHLLRSSANARRLRQSIDSLDAV